MIYLLKDINIAYHLTFRKVTLSSLSQIKNSGFFSFIITIMIAEPE